MIEEKAASSMIDRVWGGVTTEVAMRFAVPLSSALLDSRRLCGLTLQEVGDEAGGMAFSAVSVAIKRFEQTAATDRHLRGLMDRIAQVSMTSQEDDS